MARSPSSGLYQAPAVTDGLSIKFVISRVPATVGARSTFDKIGLSCLTNGITRRRQEASGSEARSRHQKANKLSLE